MPESTERDGQDAATYYSGPLQLIRIDDDGQCHLDENAACILNQIQGRLAVVGIAGLYRTGKSFLLNRLLGLQEGFEIGPTVNPCTKGLWIWGQPVQLSPDYHCVLIDTEGLGSTQRTASCDMQIFSLCILLSSYFIYNSMGAIHEQAVDDLHLVLHLAQHIHVKARRCQESERSAELSQYFPSFLWVLRDFHLRLADAAGSPISERQYLENALRPLPGQEDKNKLREVIKDLFKDRDCATIVRPVAEEADLRNIQRLPYDSLRPQFRTQVEAFVRKVYTSLKPKKIDGLAVSGPMLVKLATEYCKAINGSAVPTIHSAWTSAVQHQLRLCLKDAVQLYRGLMNDNAMQHLPMSDARVRDLHKASKAEALKVFLAPRFDVGDHKFRETRGELANRIKQLFDHVQVENMSMSRKQCERIAGELFGRWIESKVSVRGTYQNFEQLCQDWEQLRSAFLQQTAGPAQRDVLVDWLVPRLLGAAHRLWGELKSLDQERQFTLQRRLAEAEAIPGDAHGSLDAERHPHHDNFDVSKRQWLAERIELEQQVQEAKQAVEEVLARTAREKAQLADSEHAAREQVRMLQERLQSAEGRPIGSSESNVRAASSAELGSLRDAVNAALTEMKNMTADKKQLEMKAEHERQLIGLERKFQKQLMDARRKNESLIETLRQTYEDEVDALKTYRSDLISHNKELEQQLERAQGETEVLKQRLAASESEKALQKRFIETAQRQSELVVSFLERPAAKAGSGLREELGALTASPSDVSFWGAGSDRRGGNAGNMPYSAANASVFRSLPGV